ncbi:MAG: hypothetical protein JEZ03_17675, partial [Bacteroidales bacterium]|nr:hypothetical protein [Bacteroidales bacterium]
MAGMKILINKVNNQNLIASSFQNFGLIFEANGFYDSAYCYFQYSLKKYMQTDLITGQDPNISALYANLGGLDHIRKNYDSALYNYLNGLQYCEKSGYTSAGIHLNIGYTYLSKQLFDSALFYISKGLLIGDSLNFIEIKSNAYHFLAQYYDSVKQYDRSKLYLEKHMILKDSVYGAGIQERIWAIQLDYEQKQYKHELEVQRLISIFVILLVILSTGFILLFVNRQRVKHRKDNEIAVQRAELAMVRLENIDLELKQKNQRLVEYTNILKKKNDLIEKFRSEIDTLFKPDDPINFTERKKVLLQMKILTVNDWDKFKELFEEVNKGFLSRLDREFPLLSEGDKRQFLLIKLGFDKKTTAEMIGISVDSAKRARQRLTKKLKLPDASELNDFIEGF